VINRGYSCVFIIVQKWELCKGRSVVSRGITLRSYKTTQSSNGRCVGGALVELRDKLRFRLRTAQNATRKMSSYTELLRNNMLIDSQPATYNTQWLCFVEQRYLNAIPNQQTSKAYPHLSSSTIWYDILCQPFCY
jgi:hypothetical protein